MFSPLVPGASLLQVGATAGSAGLLVLVLTPVIEWLAGWGGWWDAPSDARWHDAPTPHLGGIAVFVSVSAALGWAGGWAAFSMPVWVGAGLLFAVGLADDLWGVRPGVKLVVQLGSAGLVLWTGLLFWPDGPQWIAGPLTVLWVLGLTNALNLLDAMDGVAAGVAAVAAAAFGGIAGLQGQMPLVAVAGALAAAEAGFLVFNASPARIFMGDCGSLPLGYVLAILGLGVQGGSVALPALVPVLVLAIPLFDTLFVSATRLYRGQSIAEGGVDHTMHRLVRLGGTERQVALGLWGAGALCGTLGVLGQLGPPMLAYGLGLGVAVAACVFGLLLARRTDPDPPSPSARSSSPSFQEEESAPGGPSPQAPTA